MLGATAVAIIGVVNSPSQARDVAVSAYVMQQAGFSWGNIPLVAAALFGVLAGVAHTRAGMAGIPDETKRAFLIGGDLAIFVVLNSMVSAAALVAGIFLMPTPATPALVKPTVVETGLVMLGTLSLAPALVGAAVSTYYLITGVFGTLGQATTKRAPAPADAGRSREA